MALPGNPSNVTALVQQDGSVIVNWSPTTTGLPLTRYNVEAVGVNYGVTANYLYYVSTGTTTRFTGLTQGQEYIFDVAAVNGTAPNEQVSIKVFSRPYFVSTASTQPPTINLNRRLQFAGGVPQTTLATNIATADSSFDVTDATNWPDGTVGMFPVVINKGGTTEEKVLCLTRSNNVFNVFKRGYDGTTPAPHAANETVQVCWPAAEADTANAHTSSSLGVHGLVSAVIGDVGIRTLTNKTIDANSNTLKVPAMMAVTNYVASYTPSSVGVVAVDLTHQTITFTAPANGAILVRTSCTTNSSSTTAGSTISYQVDGVTPVTFAGIPQVLHGPGLVTGGARSVSQIISGFTPGATYQLDLMHSLPSGATTSCTLTNICMEVWNTATTNIVANVLTSGGVLPPPPPPVLPPPPPPPPPPPGTTHNVPTSVTATPAGGSITLNWGNPVGAGRLSSLQSGFGNGIDSNWRINGAVTVSGGIVSVGSVAGGNPDIDTTTTWDATSSVALVKVPAIATGTTVQTNLVVDSAVAGVALRIDASSDGNIYFENQVAYVDSGRIGIPYDPVADLYWKIDFSDGINAVFMTSADSVTWVSRRSIAIPWDITAVNVYLSVDGAATTPAQFTDFNSPTNPLPVLTGYRLTRDGSDTVGGGAFSIVLPVTTLTYTLPNLTNGHLYTMTLTALYGDGLNSTAVTLTSTPTGVVSPPPPPPPPPPPAGNFTAPPAAPTNFVSLSVDVSNKKATVQPWYVGYGCSLLGGGGNDALNSAAMRAAETKLDARFTRFPVAVRGTAGTSNYITGGARGGDESINVAALANVYRAMGYRMLVVMDGPVTDTGLRVGDATLIATGGLTNSQFNSLSASAKATLLAGGTNGSGITALGTQSITYTPPNEDAQVSQTLSIQYAQAFQESQELLALDSTARMAGPCSADINGALSGGAISNYATYMGGGRLSCIDGHAYAMGETYDSFQSAMAFAVTYENAMSQAKSQMAPAGLNLPILSEFNYSWTDHPSSTGTAGQPGGTRMNEFYQAENTLYIASSIGHVLNQGGAPMAFANLNNALGIWCQPGDPNSGQADFTPMPAHWGIAAFTGAHTFSHYNNAVYATTTGSTDIEVFCLNNEAGGYNIVLINKSTSTDHQFICTLNGLPGTVGGYDAYQTVRTNPFSAPMKITPASGFALSGGKVWFNLPQRTVTTIVVR